MRGQAGSFQVRVEIEVDRPVEQVFAYLSDLRHDPHWWGGIHSSRRIHGDGGVGTRYELDATFLRVRHTTCLEVIAQDPPYAQTITVRSGPLPYTAYYTWSALTPTRTRFTFTADIATVRPFSWFGPLLSPLVSLLARRYFNRIPTLLN
jgi:uncharacterized protein YndB with AHSA1/START domain